MRFFCGMRFFWGICFFFGMRSCSGMRFLHGIRFFSSMWSFQDWGVRTWPDPKAEKFGITWITRSPPNNNGWGVLEVNEPSSSPTKNNCQWKGQTKIKLQSLFQHSPDSVSCMGCLSIKARCSLSKGHGGVATTWGTSMSLTNLYVPAPKWSPMYPTFIQLWSAMIQWYSIFFSEWGTCC